jgi:uncharacterized protein YkwD
MRTNPKAFIPDLEAMLPKFEGNLYDNFLSTQEGAAVVQELIDYLNTVEPTHALDWDDDIAKASKDHVLDCAPTGATGHDGVDGSTFGERMDRYTKREGSSGENISYGQNTAKGVVIQLAVDDGVESRGHRLNIMNGAYVKTGCFSGEHSQYTHSTVLNYNGDPRRIGKGGAIFDFGEFMAEDVVWDESEEPEGHVGYSESTSGGVGDCKATKTVTRTYNMPDGSTETREKVIEKDI